VKILYKENKVSKDKIVIKGNRNGHQCYLSNDGLTFILRLEDALNFKSMARAKTFIKNVFPSRTLGVVKDITIEDFKPAKAKVLNIAETELKVHNNTLEIKRLQNVIQSPVSTRIPTNEKEKSDKVRQERIDALVKQNQELNNLLNEE
jgi:hypothetical protein